MYNNRCHPGSTCCVMCPWDACIFELFLSLSKIVLAKLTDRCLHTPPVCFALHRVTRAILLKRKHCTVDINHKLALIRLPKILTEFCCVRSLT